MTLKNLGYYNGKIGLIEEMQVPMTDRGFYFGDGIYDAAYSRNHCIYALGEHIDRFYQNLKGLQIEAPMQPDELSKLLEELVNCVDDGEQFVYWQATRGCGLREHNFPKDGKSNLCIMLRPMKVKDIYQPIRVISYPDDRYAFCHMKTLNIMPSVLASQAATDVGVDECILHRNQRVTECSHSNVSILVNHELITPPSDHWILPGIGRKHLMQACEHFGIPVRMVPFTLEDVRNADEVIVTSAGSLCLQTLEMDGKPIGGKDPETLKRLQDYLWNDWIVQTEN